MALSDRAKRLKDMVMCTPAICVERGLYMTESYMNTQGEPVAVRRAKATAHILENMSIRIEEGELIVGWLTSKARGGALIPEVSSEWILDELETVSTRPWDKYQPLDEREKEIIRGIVPCWRGRNIAEQWQKLLPESALKANHIVTSSGGETEVGSHPAHVAVDYDLLLRVGVSGMRADVQARMDTLDMTRPESLDKMSLYRSMLITFDAVIHFAERYAALAERLSARERDAKRRYELVEISRICRKVPKGPAGSFYEALQSSWFIFVCLMIEGWGAGMTFGRVDQYLYGHYKQDQQRGLITDDFAKELITLLLIKMNGLVHLRSEMVTTFFGGYPVLQSLTLGGVTPLGEDAVNELSYLFLEAERDVRMIGEDFVIRVSRKNPEEFLLRACQVARELNGKFKFVSDDTRIQSMLYKGLPIEFARDYISAGCHVPTVPAKARDSGGVTFNFALMLELALNNGIWRQNGKRLGPATGDPRGFLSLEDITAAFKTQFESFMDIALMYKNADLKLYSQIPCPLLSSFYPGCLDRGVDAYSGGVYPYAFHTSSLTGVPNVGDSLAAIKKVVFDGKKATMAQLIDALDRNFEGFEWLQSLLEGAPKFGNNDDYVDLIVKDILSYASDYISSRATYAGIKNTPSAITMTAGIPLGQQVGALPDGRKAGEPLAEGGISPHQGRNTSGITSTLASVAKLNQVKLTGGSILNVRVSQNAVKDDGKLRKFAALLRTFCEEGGDLVQFNFISNEILREAQRHPEKYKDLLVRVATYSAYFVELGPELQEDIINRVEFGSL